MPIRLWPRRLRSLYRASRPLLDISAVFHGIGYTFGSIVSSTSAMMSARRVDGPGAFMLDAMRRLMRH